MWKLNNTTCLVAILIAMAMVFNIPSVGLAQNNQASTPLPPQPKGGVATVVGVDEPDNCLRIRSGPGNQYDVIGCANMGDQLKITGVWTSNDWAQLADNGWVYGPQVSTDLRPLQSAYSRPPSYIVSEEVVPDYDDWAYLPDYGYDTYWYGDVPIFLYNVAVWSWCHPWWWWHGLQAWWWQDGFHGRRHWDEHSFRDFAQSKGVNVTTTERANISTLNRMNRTTRSASIASANVRKFNGNPSNITSPNVSRFNPNRFNGNDSHITSPNVNRFNTNRFGTGTNTFHSQTFSNPSRSHSGTSNAFRSQKFSTPRSFHHGSIGGGQFGGAARSRGFSSPHMGGRGFHGMGGGGFHAMGGGGFHAMGGGGHHR